MFLLLVNFYFGFLSAIAYSETEFLKYLAV